MDNELNLSLAIAGLVVGVIFGFIVQRSRFCMTAIVSNFVLMRDVRQFYTYLTAVLLAIIGVFYLELSEMVSIADSAYRSGGIHWLSAISGGLVFGLGSVMAGGCIGRVLALTGEGNLGGLLALLAISLSATVMYTGAFEPIRIWLYQLAVIQTEDASILHLLNTPLWLFISFLLPVSLMLVYMSYKRRIEIKHILVGGMLGLLVIVGWWITGNVGVDEFSVRRPASLTFSGPIAKVALSLTVGNEPQGIFGFTMVIGVVFGSFMSAVSSGHFRITHPSSDSFARIFNGGLLMGVGAMLAGGCNIGQGLTGVSTLSIESILVVVAIFIGMYAGVKWLQYKEDHSSIWNGIRKQFYQLSNQIH